MKIFGRAIIAFAFLIPVPALLGNSKAYAQFLTLEGQPSPAECQISNLQVNGALGVLELSPEFAGLEGSIEFEVDLSTNYTGWGMNVSITKDDGSTVSHKLTPRSDREPDVLHVLRTKLNGDSFEYEVVIEAVLLEGILLVQLRDFVNERRLAFAYLFDGVSASLLCDFFEFNNVDFASTKTMSIGERSVLLGLSALGNEKDDEISTTKTQVDSLSEEKDELTSQVETLVSDVKTAKSVIQNQNRDIDALRERNSELRDAVSNALPLLIRANKVGRRALKNQSGSASTQSRKGGLPKILKLVKRSSAQLEAAENSNLD